MLQNSKYAGRWTFGARSWKKSPTTGKRVNRPGQSPLIEVALPELRIVDEETWSRVQAINEEARERYAAAGPSAYAREGGASTARRVYPMSTLVRCGICGGPMVIEKTQKPRYRCDASRGNGGSCDNSRTVMEDALREAFTSAEAPFSSLERQSPRRAPRALKSGQRYGLRGPDLNRRPSDYELTNAGCRRPSQQTGITEKPQT
jgi:hypothetical protein